MFYGWRMVGVAFGAQFVASGLGFYGLPRLLVPLADEFADGERAAVALLVPAMSLPGLVVAPLIGRAIARFPLHVVMPVGAGAMGLGFLIASRVTELWQLMAVYALAVPIGVSALGMIGASALVANWFDRRRPLALGISQFGLSIAGAASTFFIGWTLAQGGWRGTYLWFAGIALVTCPLLWLSITDHPRQKGLQPDGADEPGDAAHAVGAAGSITFAQAMRDPRLWLIGMAAGLCFSGTTAILQNIHAFTTDAGHAQSEADVVLATLALGAALGKLVFGALGMRLGERAAFWIAIVGQGLGQAMLPAASASLTTLIAVALVFGLALGGVMPALSALLARIYGAAQFGPVMGYVAPMLIPFQMVGAPIAAFVYDQTGSYDMAIYGFVVACAVAAVALVPLRMPSEQGRSRQESP